MGVACPESPLGSDAGVVRHFEVILGGRADSANVPLGTGGVDESRVVEPSPAGGGAPRVLIVDDEPATRLLLSVNLALAGFDVVEAESGAAALEAAAQGSFDLVLLDVISGTGLGLHISRELVREMGGDIWVEPNTGTSGSTFVVELRPAVG